LVQCKYYQSEVPSEWTFADYSSVQCFSYISGKFYSKKAPGSEDKRYYKLEIENSSDLDISISFKWENEGSAGRNKIPAGGTYTIESPATDLRYISVEIFKVRFSFNDSQRKEYGVYESDYLYCSDSSYNILYDLEKKKEEEEKREIINSLKSSINNTGNDRKGLESKIDVYEELERLESKSYYDEISSVTEMIKEIDNPTVEDKTTDAVTQQTGNEKKYNSYVDNERKIVEASLKGAKARYKREQEFAKIEEARKARESKPSDAYWFDGPEKRAALAKEQNAAGIQEVQNSVQNLANTMDAAFRENGKRRAARKQAEREQRWKEEKEKSYADANQRYREGLLTICGSFNNGIALVESYKLDEKYYNSDDAFFNVDILKSRGKAFFIDRNGNNVFREYWETAEDFYNGIARVGNSKFTYININGDVLTTKGYDWVDEKFTGIFAQVRLDGKYGLIDRSGNEVVKTLYKEIGAFHEGLAFVKKNDNYGYIDDKGNVIIPFKYWKASDFDNNRAVVYEESNKIVIDKNGNTIADIKFSDVFEYSEGLAMVRTGGPYDSGKDYTYGFIDKGGGLVIPIMYSAAKDFSEGLAGVYINGKGGFIDKTGATVIPFEYDIVFWFKNGVGVVAKKGYYSFDKTYALIDKNNKFLISFDNNYKSVNFPSEGLIAVQKDKRYGFIDIKNNIKIPFKYYEVSSFENGMAKVSAPVKCDSPALSPDINENRVEDCEEASESWYIDKRGRCVKDCNNIPNGFR